jgi:D-alanyl-D-alanine carboxypeptidase (penicillin-binding protein 5/6)
VIFPFSFFPFMRKPHLVAESAICARVSVDPEGSVEVLFKKAKNKLVPPASITKLMTAIVALETAQDQGIDLHDSRLSVIASDMSGRDTREDDELSLYDALANLLISSSNTMANMLARVFGELLREKFDDRLGSMIGHFITAMNEKAFELGMGSTIFSNSSGLAQGRQLSTAEDILKLTVAAAAYDVIMSLWGRSSYVLNIHGPHARAQKINSSVKISGDNGLLGAKTGSLVKAVYNITTLSETPRGNRIVTVVLRAPTRESLYKDLRNVWGAVGRRY